jgi:hypothetical protein
VSALGHFLGFFGAIVGAVLATACGGHASRLLRDDLEHLSLRGSIPERAVAFDGWFERPLLALPFDGSAPRELSKDVPTASAVSTAHGRVYWSTSTGELWMMTP